MLALVAEFYSGTFYLLVVCIAMLIGGLAAWMGLSESSQLLLASIAGVLGVFVVYRYKQRQPSRVVAQKQDDADLGKTVQILQIPEHGRARIHYRGTTWDAVLLDDELTVDSQAYIVGRDGNTFKISSSPPKE
ncbi:NfeD family protein [Neisseriaceae bacterium TC5R-5]|nr:NfeD family protein [Neisseriaceae bacterium TC5R-5]